MRRNRNMVDASRILNAAFDGRPGGTARTLEYAARRRLEIIQIPIDSAPVGIRYIPKNTENEKSFSVFVFGMLSGLDLFDVIFVA